MQDISLSLDTDPTADLCIEMVECDVLNYQAHQELSSYNESRKFAFVHPLVISRMKNRSLENELHELQRIDPEKFLNEITNTRQNIRRIESNIRKKKYRNKDEFIRWENNINLARDKLKILMDLVKK